MNDFDIFVENLKTFWNQPVPIIGFTIGMVIVGILFIVAKTSIGKKALNKIKDINDKLSKQNDVLQSQLKDVNNRCNKFVDNVSNITIPELKDYYNNVIKEKYEQIAEYKNELSKRDGLLGVICENSVNVKIKEAWKNYDKETTND